MEEQQPYYHPDSKCLVRGDFVVHFFGNSGFFKSCTLKKYANSASEELNRLVKEIDLGNDVIRKFDTKIQELTSELEELKRHAPDVSGTAPAVPKTRRRKPLDAARNEIILALIQVKKTKNLFSKQLRWL
jgi:hypothetical protein